jgi:protein TonB
MRWVGKLKEKRVLFAMVFSLALHGCLAYIFIPSSFTSPETLGHPIEVVWETKDSRPSSPEPKMPLKQKEKKATPSKTSLTPIKKVSVHSPVALSNPLPSFHQKEQREGENPAPSRHTLKRKAHHPLPTYPWVCRKRHQEGVVALKVKINEDGLVTEVLLHKSSGHTRLDEVTLEVLRSWIFAEDSCTKILSIAFRLRG